MNYMFEMNGIVTCEYEMRVWSFRRDTQQEIPEACYQRTISVYGPVGGLIHVQVSCTGGIRNCVNRVSEGRTQKP